MTDLRRRAPPRLVPGEEVEQSGGVADDEAVLLADVGGQGERPQRPGQQHGDGRAPQTQRRHQVGHLSRKSKIQV
eukprot:545095-Pyramimonas_sp.AAC.1